MLVLQLDFSFCNYDFGAKIIKLTTFLILEMDALKLIFQLYLATMSTSIFVSGATGLLGSHVLVELLRSDKKVKALFRNPDSIIEVKTIVQFYGMESRWDNIEWLEGDILDVDRLQDILKDVSHVYHCAALVSFNPSDSRILHKINVEGTRNMLNASKEKGVHKFLHVSSTAAIGKGDKSKLCTEDSKWENSDKISYYAKSKFSSEREVWRANEEGLNTVIVNPCVIIGPGDPTKSSGTLFSTISNGMKFYTEGSNAFVDVRDVASIMIQLMSSDISNERFLCIGENMKFREIFNIIADELEVNRPSIKANKFMTGLAWRLMKVVSFITKATPAITSETAASSHKSLMFSNQKIRDYINFEFTPISSSVKNAVAYLKATQKLK